MNVDTILISEYASATPDGRLTVVNAFNQLHGPGPKWGIPILYLTMVAHAPRREAGKEWDGEIRLIDANREPVMDEPLPFRIGFMVDEERVPEGMPMRAIVSVAFAGLQFIAAGPYAFEVYVDGTFAAATMLYVNQVPAKTES